MMFSISNKQINPFGVIVSKEISDTVKSWKFIILVALVLLTCLGSLYAALSDFSAAIKGGRGDDNFFFLKLYTHSNGTVPSFLVFVSFLGPLLGISMGFDSINTEQNKGTLSRLLAQPIYRDYILNAKFIASLSILSALFIGLSLLVLGFGLIFIGIPPTADELLRIFVYSIINIIYVGFWLNLSILFSVKFRQSATSALAGISVWLFFTVFYGMIVNIIAQGIAPARFISEYQMVNFERFVQNLMRFNPGQLFNDVTTTLLQPSVRSLGPLTTEQTIGAIPNPLPLGQSLLLVWPQVFALISGTLLFFAIAYTLFMRREIRSR
ncbi:ABC transporter permease [Saccharicrinis aurantiacus]|uniref:ABC transporter permease n=1 Tax=Saccharicrinis aurantiacus TaxID=1849719 RepID=UPI0024922601|nr:ABC transporter permease subunit [Saccharicrinis aurantiacus]